MTFFAQKVEARLGKNRKQKKGESGKGRMRGFGRCVNRDFTG